MEKPNLRSLNLGAPRPVNPHDKAKTKVPANVQLEEIKEQPILPPRKLFIGDCLPSDLQNSVPEELKAMSLLGPATSIVRR